MSIIGLLQSSNYNLENLERFARLPMLHQLLKVQLNTALILLEKGYSIYDEVEPLLEKYGDINDVPEINK